MENVFERFERQLNTVLKNYSQMKAEKAALKAERDHLLTQHQEVMESLERMVERLEQLNHESDSN